MTNIRQKKEIKTEYSIEIFKKEGDGRNENRYLFCPTTRKVKFFLFENSLKTEKSERPIYKPLTDSPLYYLVR